VLVVLGAKISTMRRTLRLKTPRRLNRHTVQHSGEHDREAGQRRVGRDFDKKAAGPPADVAMRG
jgi:hypothetical protein